MNIAEILIHKPKGTKLYDLLYDKTVELDEIITANDDTVIWCMRTKDPKTFEHYSYSEVGTLRGHEDGLRILLPSKEMHDWSKFAWQRGDVLKSDGDMLCFFNKFSDDSYANFEAKYLQYNRAEGVFIAPEVAEESVEDWYEKASPEESKKYIKNVEESFNGKFNMETLEIVPNKPVEPNMPNEPKFKPFDKVIVRAYDKYWRIDFFEHYNKDVVYYPYQCMIDSYKECLPYNEETAKLIGTCEDYKNV